MKSIKEVKARLKEAKKCLREVKKHYAPGNVLIDLIEEEIRLLKWVLEG